MLLEQKNRLKLHFQRFEFKYQVPLAVVEGIIPEFLKYMDYDPYAMAKHDGSYLVTSLYLDSVGYGCYHEKVAGLRTRKKLRIRTYEKEVTDETPVFLEIKKKYDTVVIKDRMTMPYGAVRAMFERNEVPAGVSSDQEETLHEFLSLKLRNGMVPQNLVVYNRQPFISKIDPGFRVTIDSQLRTSRADSLNGRSQFIEVRPGMAVIEVKFNNMLPQWFHVLIQRYGLDQRPFSKYCFSLEQLIPGLTGNSLLETYNPTLAYKVNN